MAAEYSRELSVKVHAGQARVTRLGFRHGAPIGYALRRELVDDDLRPQGILRKGEQKWLRTCHVRVRPGTANEVAVVRWVFEQCLLRKTDAQIARELNRQVVPSVTGRPWNPKLVARVLRNENYIGNLVYNRASRKLGAKKVYNLPNLWVRGEHCVEPIVEPEIFQRVQRIIENRRIELPEEQMLSRLRRTLFKRGRLSPAIIEETIGLPCVDAYIRHFGSLRDVYRLIGYTSERDYSFIDAAKAWADVVASLALDVSFRLKKLGRKARVGPSDDHLSVDDKTVLFRVARSFPKEGHLTYWCIPRVDQPPAQWIVVIRLADGNKAVLDYVLIPREAVVGRYVASYVRITERARIRLRFERFETVDALVRRMGRFTRRKCRHRAGGAADRGGGAR